MVYLWIRRPIPWEDHDASMAALRPGMRARADQWNDTFTIPFPEFRDRIRELTFRNHDAVEGAVKALWEDIPEGAPVLPIDDDDWLAPDAALVVERELDPELTGYYWPGRWIERPKDFGYTLHLLRRRLLPSTPQVWTCATNCYVLPRSEWTKPLLDSHSKASRWFDGEGAARVKKLDRPLSVINRTLASLTTLVPDAPSLSRRRLLAKYRSHRTLYDRPLPPEVAWADPYRIAMGELMAELEVKPA